ncbi:hypothetical protein ACFQ4G_10390 [Methylobacterium marchantiae]|uniref:RNA-binding S4 domain-containing protein n=1 Tax=Methylobacterium marchantiae TaxID=600331 RepID=A0ABW3WXC9_9HYPH
MLRIEAVPNRPLRKSRIFDAAQRKDLLTFSAGNGRSWRRIEQWVGKIALNGQAVEAVSPDRTIEQPAMVICARRSGWNALWSPAFAAQQDRRRL